MTTYIYRRTEEQLWTVGYYDPADRWHALSDHGSPEEAAEQVHYLNGGCPGSCREGTR